MEGIKKFLETNGEYGKAAHKNSGIADTEAAPFKKGKWQDRVFGAPLDDDKPGTGNKYYGP